MYLKRYQLLKSRKAKDWWTATFGDPVSWIILAAIGDWRFITPNLLTVLTFIAKIIASVCIAFGNQSIIIYGAILLQIGVVFDHMDGNLARYRNISTLKGGFMDRILDGISVLIIFSSLSWNVYQNGDSAYFLLMGPTAASFYLIICYIYWSYAFDEYRALGQSKKVHPGAENLRDKKISTLKYILRGQKKFFKFNHIDYYFWITLAIFLDKISWVIWSLFIIIGSKMIGRFKMRLNHLSKLDKQ
mgnify:FL=1